MWQAAKGLDYGLVALVPPIILVNMIVRALRWRVLLREGDAAPPLWPVFSALTIGYLANNVLPARGGDVLRAWLLGTATRRARSRILATVLVERVLDVAAIVVVFALAAALVAVPPWMKNGALILAAGTVAALLLMLLLSAESLRLADLVLRPVRRLSPWLATRLAAMMGEFVGGIGGFRRLSVALPFFVLTAIIWATEVTMTVLVAEASHLPLGAGEALVLMLFGVFASFIPALPGQLGAFEVAVMAGLDFLGRGGGGAALAFTLAWHFIVLLGTSAIGAICLAVDGRSLSLPRDA
jgi:hypothetical protein